MRCPFCQYPNNRVLESRSAESGQSVRRRRECLACERRFTTYERIEFVPITVIKCNGDRESFDRSKLLKGIARACEKTGVSALSQENFVDEIEAKLQQRSLREVPSSDIGDLVLHHLRQLNEIAYVRFASVYRQFTSVNDFIQALKQLQQQEQAPNGISTTNSASINSGPTNSASTNSASTNSASTNEVSPPRCQEPLDNRHPDNRHPDNRHPDNRHSDNRQDDSTNVPTNGRPSDAVQVIS